MALTPVTAQVYSFGDTQNGRCGHHEDRLLNCFRPMRVTFNYDEVEGGAANVSIMTSISCGYYHSLAVSSQGVSTLIAILTP